MKIKASKSAGKTKPPLPPFSFASLPAAGPSFSSASGSRAASAAIPLPASDIKLHPPSTLSHPGPTVSCPDCGKPVLRAALSDHAVNCQRIRDGLQPDSTSDLTSRSDAGGDDHSAYGAGEPSGLNRKRRLSNVSISTSTPPPSSKKAKSAPSAAPSTSHTPAPSLVPERPSPAPSGSEAGMSSVGGFGGSNWGGESSSKKGRGKNEKKLRKESEKKTQKVEPLDLDRRCGVINDKNVPCLRSLTCKSHGMGPKRDVQGRSKPFDVLLLEWNRVNNPRFAEPKSKRNGTNAGDGIENGSMGGGGGGGKKRNHHAGKSRRHRDDDSMDGGGGRSSPESGLNSLIAAARASRARLSAPSASFASSPSRFVGESRPSSPLRPLSAVPSSFRSGAPLATAGGGGCAMLGGIPREGWKGSLYGRRRGLTTGLNRSLMDALGVK